MPRRLLLPLFILLALAAALGCQPTPAEIADGDDPLAALRASAPTSRYKEPFWSEHCHRGNVTWQDALAFCRTEGKDAVRYPNCQHVRIVARWEEPPRFPAPAHRFGDVPALREWERQLPPPHRPAPPAPAGERP